jgi:Fe-S cluster biosynthesis and repair protein YggX
MPTVHCLRCNSDSEGFAAAPLPPPHGDELLAYTCQGCFRDWMNTEIMIINEYRLDLANPRNQELLNQEMARFLSLPSAQGEQASGPPPEAKPV